MWWKGLLTKAFPVLKDDKGNWLRNPQVITDKFIDNGEIVYGEYKAGDEFKQARGWVNEKIQKGEFDFALMDAEVNRICWTFANLFPGCLMKSIDGIRQKKKFFWDTMKNDHRYWLATNMMGEAFLGFGAFNTKKITGKDTIDFIKNRQLIAQGALNDEAYMEQILGKPQSK
jgi:6-oxo-cyclohex-1-ene-carbonyl-CoA hydrolase